METIYDHFREQVAMYPEATAVFDEHRRLTFSELDGLTDIIATGFPVVPAAFGESIDCPGRFICRR